MGGGGRGVQEGGDMCIPMADSHGCMAETNTTLSSNYPPIKKIIFFKKDSLSQDGIIWLQCQECQRLRNPHQDLHLRKRKWYTREGRSQDWM